MRGGAFQLVIDSRPSRLMSNMIGINRHPSTEIDLLSINVVVILSVISLVVTVDGYSVSVKYRLNPVMACHVTCTWLVT
jgi:hypothetical protein